MTSQTVFISSRLDELEDERQKVEDGINELWNQENMPFKVWDWKKAKEIPSGKNADEIQSEGVRNSDIYVLILGSEYGNFEYGESSTHKEYKIASSNIEEDCILLYISEVEDKEEKLDRWIREFKEKRKPSYKLFKNPDDLKNLVKIRLRDLWNKEKGKANKVDVNGKLPDIRVEVGIVRASDGRNFISLEAKNHDKNPIFLSYPKIMILNSREYFPIIQDSVNHLSVPTGELKPGDSRLVLVDPNELGIDNLDRFENVIFPDKIGREFKGSAKATLKIIEEWKSAEASRTHGGI